MTNHAEYFRIGLIADTHDVDDPLAVVHELARHGCHYNIHLGDIGGSPTVMHVVRKYKRHLGDVGHLSRHQRAQFQHLVAQGTSPLRAYIETQLAGQDPILRIAQTAGAYRAILGRMSPLANPILLRGNVDGQQLRGGHIQDCFEGSPLHLVERPRMIDLGWLGLILWPSWRTTDAAELDEQVAITDSLTAAARHKQMIFVAAHEQCLKGPSAEQYAANVAKAGLAQRSIPRFDPNPTWRCLLSFFRRLPAGVPCYYAFGHVHDPLEVIAAGAPALRNPDGPGLRYRVCGLGWRGTRPKKLDGRRHVVQLPVGVDEVAVCELRRGESGISWQVIKVASSG